MGQLGEDNQTTDFTKVTMLDTSLALTHTDTIALQYGPIILSKDVRLNQDVDSKIKEDTLDYLSL